MDAWSKQFLKKLMEAGFDINAFMKYVDDVNIIIGKKEKGWRWGDDGQLVRKQGDPTDEKEEEKEKSGENNRRGSNNGTN